MAVDYTTRDGVAVITLNNPPVNGLGLSTRLGIMEGLERAQRDPAVAAIVLTGAGRAFSGGADITEFNTPKALQEPTLHTVIDAVEASGKPVVVALHGAARGGGRAVQAVHAPEARAAADRLPDDGTARADRPDCRHPRRDRAARIPGRGSADTADGTARLDA